jgi:hypothetical protein
LRALMNHCGLRKRGKDECESNGAGACEIFDSTVLGQISHT